MTKKEFRERVAIMKRVSEQNLALLESPFRAQPAQPVYDGPKEHDPELARLVGAADCSAVEPLRQLLRYVSRRVEN